MNAPRIFSDRQMVGVMHRLHLSLDATCSRIGDISLGEQALLTNVGEFDSGFPLKWAQEELMGLDVPRHFVDLLERKELVSRIRSKIDKRGFALTATQKGRARLTLVDEAIAAALIYENKRWKEEEFAYLTTQMHALPNIFSEQRRITTIFSGEFLAMVHRYHQIIIQVASHYGLTSLQLAILCAFEEGKTRAPDHFKHLAGVSESVIEFQMNDLKNKNLVRINRVSELTEKGTQRRNDLLAMITSQMDALFVAYPESDTALFEDLGEYCMYLFSS